MAQKEQAALVEANGALLIPSGSLQTIPTDTVDLGKQINITTIIAGAFDTEITSIRIQDKETLGIFEYADVEDNYNWDSKTLSAYDYLRIPDRYRLYSINVDNTVKGVLENTIDFKPVV